MIKYILTYLLLFLVTATVVVPRYTNIFEEVCEISGMEAEKDCDETNKELEIKYLHFTSETNNFCGVINRTKLTHHKSFYRTIYQKQENPPPED
ncbi:hypothetical protein [Tenacibaculum sp. C7A-26P2]|uniref:hypothetical protein n=1 Tax=Tenacibaculum sp. C7A-26P2 TaxID=3447504 RepID=UPI003F84566C